MRAGSSSGLSPPLFSFLLSAWPVPTIRNGRMDGGKHGQRDEGRDERSQKDDREAESNMGKGREGRGKKRKVR